ncbi:hypothetical protein C8R44DRAFT_887040 [Mycena epipterygia]|nr:hypothetical protein C8R44DRAFT_887040 [Mycena epipterygia]
MHQSSGIQLSPDAAAIATDCSSQATIRDSMGANPSCSATSGRSQLHRARRRRRARRRHRRLHPPRCHAEATKVKAAVSPRGNRLRVAQRRPIASFMTTWKVPAVPAVNHGQAVFLLNSIETNSGNAIPQLALQYGSSTGRGGTFWTLATWYVVGDQTFFTTPISVRASLDGAITLTSSGTSSPRASETLEAYVACDYPTGSTAINLKLSSGAVPTVARSKVSDTVDGLIPAVDTNGATNVVITIAYEVEERQLYLAAFFWYQSCNDISMYQFGILRCHDSRELCPEFEG